MPRKSNARAIPDFHTVDRESGQVYTETVSDPAVSLANGATWVHESPYMPVGWEEGSPFEAPPLRHLAMRKFLSDQRNLTPALFTNVPWRIASDCWDCLGRCNKKSLHMWKLLATAYPAEFSKIEQYRSMKIEGPKLSMRDYLGLTKSDSMSWRVVLTLGASYARIPELVGISEIRNLVALDIASPPDPALLPDDTSLQVTALTDRIIRSWSELAETTDAFTQLRVLILRHQLDLSKVALHYLRAFPNLQFVVAFDCPGISTTLSKGDVDGWTISEMKDSTPKTLYGFYDANCKSFGGNGLLTAETPVLDFQIGQMKSKSRRADSHSAVYLQRTNDAPTVDPEASSRKRNRVRTLDGQREQSRKPKAVMKDRTRDIGDVLSSFF
ncbi:uncharacterized protein BDV17DRAFT_35987 [Aspergillus undulatus]|uniref:uncharacterized protein n=1 Tax=Aspergillus undulatus TaxID=1810928 RepID=UPI003CCE46CA